MASRFVDINDDVRVDLAAVTFVSCGAAVVGGVYIKLPCIEAARLRRYWQAYTSSRIN